MSYQIPYEFGTFRPGDDLIPGNSESENPVVFELIPAGGQDLARLKSIIYASAGLVDSMSWSPDLQAAVLAAFESGPGVFERCVVSIQGFSVPAALAVRVGLLDTIPTKADDNGQVRPDPKANFPITTGPAFARVVGFVTALALMVAFEISKLSRQVEKLDTRLFVSPSGSPSAGTPSGPTGTVKAVRKRSGRRETAA